MKETDLKHRILKIWMTKQPLHSHPAPVLTVYCVLWPQQEKLLARLFGTDGPLNSALWEDASVRSGWVKGVHRMVRHQPALHFLCNGGEYL